MFSRGVAAAHATGFIRRFLPVWATGLIGVLALLTQPPPAKLIAGTLGHLPALSQSVELNGPIVARTLELNGLAGLVCGWLFWRPSLESAMLAHATTHVGLALWRELV